MLRALALLGEHQAWLNNLAIENCTCGELSSPPSTSTEVTRREGKGGRKGYLKSPYFLSFNAGEHENAMRTRSGLNTGPGSKIEEAHPRQKNVIRQGQLGTPPVTPAKTATSIQTHSTHLRSSSSSRNGLGFEKDKIVDERPPTPESLPRTRKRRNKKDEGQVKDKEINLLSQPYIDVDESESTKRKRKGDKKKVEVVVEIPTHAKSKERAIKKSRSARKQKGGKEEHGVDKLDKNKLLARSEKGVLEQVGKIHLIQERLRHDPWKMLIATSLLNKTSGRAARPVLEILLDTWRTPQALAEASIPDLATLLYPLGLYNQRAASLVRFSRQYLDLGWDIFVKHRTELPTASPKTILLPIPSPSSASASALTEDSTELEPELDVKVFHGSGVYASDSFRIFSPLLDGKGAPDQEAKWLGKRERAIGRIRQAAHTDYQVQVDEGADEQGEYGVEEVGDHMSDDDDEYDDGEDEWRRVVPNDKELRRYLIWRWGIEGIVYDIHHGPQLTRERDIKRLGRTRPAL